MDRTNGVIKLISEVNKMWRIGDLPVVWTENIKMWTVVENIRIMSGMVELAMFTGLLYWFFTSSRVADMLEVVSERVGGWCGGMGRVDEPAGASSLRRLAFQRRRQRDVYSKVDSDRASRTTALHKVKESCVVPAPAPPVRPPAGLACSRCAPISRESWHSTSDSGQSNFKAASVINILDIGRQTYANGGVVSRYLCDLAQCCSLQTFHYPDVVPQVMKDDQYQKALEGTTQEELRKAGADEDNVKSYTAMRKKVESKAMKILVDISSAMSNTVLKVVAWLCHKAIRRVAGEGCGTRAVSVERLRRAAASGLPLIFVPLHRSHLDYILVTFTLYLTGIRPPLVAAGDNMRIPLFGWFLRGCGAFYIRRRVDGSEYHGDPIYKSALRAYILSSLAEKNNLEFFIEGGRTRTGKPQLPKAGILSVIMDAYLEGTIEDALIVPVTLNYDRLVDGNFVREQLGMPKQMETFWSALKGIWHMLNTNHGGIRVDFNQPFSLKEVVMSFEKYNYLKSPAPDALVPPNNNLAANLDRRILFNHSNSSLYGADVSADHKIMVEAIGRHIVYDAASSMAVMCTDMVAYTLLTEVRGGCSLQELCACVEARARDLSEAGRDMGYSGDTLDVVCKAVEMLGPGLVRKETSLGGDKVIIKPVLTVASALELSYYANTIVAHYAPSAIVATALESIVHGQHTKVRHSELMSASLQLCEMLAEEFLLCAPCQRIEDLLVETVDLLVSRDILSRTEVTGGIEEENWSRRYAQTLEEDEEEEGRVSREVDFTYTVGTAPHALADRRRLLLNVRPLTEAYAATCAHLESGTQKAVVKATLDDLLTRHVDNDMIYGEAVSMDAIRNCLRLLKLWGVVEMKTEKRDRLIRVLPPYEDQQSRSAVCANILKFNVDSPLLR